MQYGFIIPDGNIHTAPELAREAEAAGWDGVFIPDCISIETSTIPAGPGFDPWIVLAAMAIVLNEIVRRAEVHFGRWHAD